LLLRGFIFVSPVVVSSLFIFLPFYCASEIMEKNDKWVQFWTKFGMSQFYSTRNVVLTFKFLITRVQYVYVRICCNGLGLDMAFEHERNQDFLKGKYEGLSK
jgi:hypothetical protein